MSFIANEPSSLPPPPPETTPVGNDGFFPDIDLGKLRDAVRLDGTVTPARLRPAVVKAVIGINRELADWKADQLRQGIPALSQLEPKIDGKAVQLHLYLTALYHTVKADLTEKYHTFDATKSGAEEAARQLLTVDDDRREAKWAIRDLLGVERTTVELI